MSYYSQIFFNLDDGKYFDSEIEIGPLVPYEKILRIRARDDWALELTMRRLANELNEAADKLQKKENIS